MDAIIQAKVRSELEKEKSNNILGEISQRRSRGDSINESYD